MTDFDAIAALASQYFEGLYTGDTALLARIFHQRSRLHVMLEGKLTEIEFAPYMDIVRDRQSPQALGAQREDRIIAICQTSADTAFIVVGLLLAGKSYTDQLSLIKDEGRWQIISKVYHLNDPAASSTPAPR